MEINFILQIVAGLLGGGGVLWGAWMFIQPRLAPNASRDRLVEEVFRQFHKHTMIGDASDPSVPDRATALQYTEAVLRYMEKHGSKEGVEALVVVLSEIASPTTPKE